MYKSFVVALIAMLASHSGAITEDENVMSMKDADMTKERPKIAGYDMDEDTIK